MRCPPPPRPGAGGHVGGPQGRIVRSRKGRENSVSGDTLTSKEWLNESLILSENARYAHEDTSQLSCSPYQANMDKQAQNPAEGMEGGGRRTMRRGQVDLRRSRSEGQS